MSRRVSLPGADELFRPGSAPEPTEETSDSAGGDHAAAGPADGWRGSGRVRHDEKMTVYVTADELFDLETARLSLRRRHGVTVDRGRLVREAIAIVLADLEENGADSDIARRLAAS